MSHDRGPTFARAVDHRKPLHVTRENFTKLRFPLNCAALNSAGGGGYRSPTSTPANNNLRGLSIRRSLSTPCSIDEGLLNGDAGSPGHVRGRWTRRYIPSGLNRLTRGVPLSEQAIATKISRLWDRDVSRYLPKWSSLRELGVLERGGGGGMEKSVGGKCNIGNNECKVEVWIGKLVLRGFRWKILRGYLRADWSIPLIPCKLLKTNVRNLGKSHPGRVMSNFLLRYCE